MGLLFLFLIHFSLFFQEEELRKEGGKFAHLNDELHVYVEAFAEMTDGYRRLSHAVTELKKFLIPVSNFKRFGQSYTNKMKLWAHAVSIVLC